MVVWLFWVLCFILCNTLFMCLSYKLGEQNILVVILFHHSQSFITIEILETGLKYMGSPWSKFTSSIRKRSIELGEFKSYRFVLHTIKSGFPFIGLTSSRCRWLCTELGYQFLCYFIYWIIFSSYALHLSYTLLQHYVWHLVIHRK